MFTALLCISLLSLPGSSRAAVKRWLPDTRWETGRNWEGGKTPCPGQRASLGHAQGLSIHLSSAADLGALVFPKTGELVLEEGAALRFDAFETDGDCVGEAQFVAQERVHWYNPDHWALRESSQLLPESVESRPDTDPRPPAVPDAEMVPCPTDFVIFEDDRFRVDTDGLTPLVREVQIGDRIYGGPEMAQLLDTKEGKAMFSGVVKSGTPDCDIPEGCSCGNDQPEPLERICLQHAPKCSEYLPCQDSIVLIGNCCPICASSVSLHVHPGFVFDDIVQLLFNHIVEPKYGGHVQAYVHRTYNSLVQIIAVDLGSTRDGMPVAPGYAHKLATDIYNKLTGTEAARYKVASASLSGSVQWNGSSTATGAASQGGSVAGIVVGILFLLLLLAGLAWLVIRRYGLHGLRHPKTLFRGRPLLPMARFDDGRIELDLGTTPHDALVPSGDESSFENPTAGPFEVFPKTGELVLEEDAALRFDAFETDGDCVGEAQFVAQERVHWYNPDHWSLRESSQLLPESVESRPDSDPRPPAVPDAEMVPCPTDFVIFEDDRFHVDTDGLTPLVREIQIGDRIYGGPEMAQLLDTKEGKAMFSGVVKSGTPDCDIPEGCSCGNDQPEPLERICLQHAPKCSEYLPCQDSIVLIGNCCPICASSVSLHVHPGFVFDDIVQLLFNHIVEPKYGGHVQAYVHRTYNSLVQIIAVDLGSTRDGMPVAPGYAHKLATDIYNKLTGTEAARYKVASASLSGSVQWNGSSTATGAASQGGSVAGIVVGILFLLLLLAGLAWLVIRRYGLHGLRHPKTLFRGRPLLPMARFDDGRIELDLGTTPHDALVPSGDESSFENPTAGPFESFPHFDPSEKQSGAFSNPVYEAEGKSDKTQDPES